MEDSKVIIFLNPESYKEFLDSNKNYKPSKDCRFILVFNIEDLDDYLYFNVVREELFKILKDALKLEILCKAYKEEEGEEV